MALFLLAAAVVPKVIAADEESGILIQEPLLDNLSASEPEAETLMLDASLQLRSLVTVQGAAAQRFQQALRGAGEATEHEYRPALSMRPSGT